MTIEVTCDRARIDVALIHRYLSEESYWAKGIPRDVVERSIEHSLPFGAFDGEEQVGFARVITDYATFAYIADVFVVESHRGRGISKRIMSAIREHPALQGLRRWQLVTRDAHALYAQYGFTPLQTPERHMEAFAKDAYLRVGVIPRPAEGAGSPADAREASSREGIPRRLCDAE